MSGWVIPTILGWDGDFQELGHWHFLVFCWCLGTVMVPLAVSFSLLIEDQGLVEVDLSAILDAFDSYWFSWCPQAWSFFQKLCTAPFPPVSVPSRQNPCFDF